MPKPSDIVRVMKVETAATGGDPADEANEEGFAEPIDPTEDGVDAGGYRAGSASWFYEDGSGNAVLEDAVTGPQTLATLAGTTAPIELRRHFLLGGM